MNDWWKVYAGGHPQLWAAVVLALQLCKKARLVEAKDSQVDIQDPETIALYVANLVECGFAAEDVQRAFTRVTRQSEFFPKPHDMTRAVRFEFDRLPKPSIANAVATIDGREVLGTAKAFEAQGVAYRTFEDLRGEGSPMGADERKALRARLDALPEPKRMPPPAEGDAPRSEYRSVDDVPVDPEDAEQTQARLRQLKEGIGA